MIHYNCKNVDSMVIGCADGLNLSEEFTAYSQKIKDIISSLNQRKDKAGEYLSTGIMLIVMGALGCVFIGLMVAGVLPFKPRGLVSYIIDAVMFLFFALFIYFGIHSLTRYKDYKVKAVAENDENAEFEEWFKKTITMSFIDSDLEITDDEQTNFFKRNAKIKYLISQNFPSVSESLADLMIDKYYGDIFE